jgi:hypothetical protein
MLQHPRFVEVHPSVYRLADVELDEGGRVDAARRAVPADARVSHGTRLRLLGVRRGPLLPIHLTIGRELHLKLPGIMLHRTALMRPHDDEHVSVEAAYIGYAMTARLIDLIVIGDWLLHRGHMTKESVLALAKAQSWRPGAAQVVAVMPHLDGRSRSLPESETRVFLTFAGLPKPEVNLDVHDEEGVFLACGDLVYVLWRLFIEYEGGQHWTDPDQIASDVDRYARLRRTEWGYLQVTKRHLAAPTAMVRTVHRALVARGYDGPAPEFGRVWGSLFTVPRASELRRVA